jgi:hypothetical protein
MPTKDKSQFALINRIRGKTSYFAHLTAQEDLNDGKINRIQSNGGSGVAQWAKSIGGTNTDSPVKMVLDSEGNLYVTGKFISFSLTIDSLSSLTNSTPGSNDTFIVKYNSSGVAQWAKNNNATGNDAPVNMVLGPTGYVYISGYYTSAITFM